MNSNKQNLINKIKYRSQYRGTKEMDLFINKFVNSIIHDLDLNQLIELNNLINLGDEELIKISDEEIKENDNKVVFLLKEFNPTFSNLFIIGYFIFKVIYSSIVNFIS